MWSSDWAAAGTLCKRLWAVILLSLFAHTGVGVVDTVLIKQMWPYRLFTVITFSKSQFDAFSIALEGFPFLFFIAFDIVLFCSTVFSQRPSVALLSGSLQERTSDCREEKRNFSVSTCRFFLFLFCSLNLLFAIWHKHARKMQDDHVKFSVSFKLKVFLYKLHHVLLLCETSAKLSSSSRR